MKQEDQTTAENCPLCGEGNHCANLSSCESNEDCWCKKPDVKFPESLLSKVPVAKINKACICQSCLLKHAASERA